MVIFFYIDFQKVGWFWQNDARLFEKGKLIPDCHLKTKYLVVLPLPQLPRACKDPLLAIFGWQRAAAKLLIAVLSTEHLLNPVRAQHETHSHPVATTGRYCEVWTH